MTIRDNVPAGAPCWVDLMSSDVEKSKAFYGELFGWTADEPNPEFGGYTNFRKDGEQVAGLMTAQEAGMPDVWSVYLAVDRRREDGGRRQGQRRARCSSSRWRSATSARWPCWPTPAAP